MEIVYDRLYVGGEWRAPAGTDRIDVFSASSEEHVGSVPEGVELDVDAAVAAARQAFEDPTGWATWEPARRAEVMERFAEEMDARADEIARRVSIQNGMPITTAETYEGVFSSVLLHYYAGLARELRDEEREGMFGGATLVRRVPAGVVGAIIPWNFPQSLAFFKIAPALAAGCTMVIKPSPETVLDAFMIAEAAIEAGVPAGVINIVPGGREVGAYLVSHPGVDKIAFTGSTGAGRQIAETCGRLLRPVTLELGGKSAAIILDDADLGSFGPSLFNATMLNNGQTCFLGTRVLAPRSRYSEIVDSLADMVNGLVVGDALDSATEVGPLASARQRDRVESYIAKGRSDGGRLVVGGSRPAGLDRGWFVEPTVFADVDVHHTIAHEEIFGPVLSVVAYDGDDEAIRIANDSDYGLGGSVWTSDHDRGLGVAKGVRTGTIGINGYMPDPTAPFGGVKASGVGRELGPEGLATYLAVQSVYL